jgi:hypothetical protein
MKSTILVLFAFFSLELYCQTIKPDVLASSGGSGTTEHYSMNWTLGEAFIYEYTNDEFTLSQGFHQNFSGIPTHMDDPVNSLNIIAFPNPVSDCLSIEINNNDLMAIWKVEIFDARGILLENWKSERKRFEINFSSFENGTYLVRISQKNISSVFHIIKNETSHEKN